MGDDFLKGARIDRLARAISLLINREKVEPGATLVERIEAGTEFQKLHEGFANEQHWFFVRVGMHTYKVTVEEMSR